MAHIVFLTGDYYPLPSANGVCASSIINELVNRGHLVDVICNGKVKCLNFAGQDGVRIHTVRGNLPRKFLIRVWRKILSYPRMVYWPVGYPWKIRQMTMLFDEIHFANSVDVLIAVQMPSEAVEAGIRIKKTHPNIRTGLYVLDSIANTTVVHKGIGKLLKNKGAAFEINAHNMYDHVFHMEYNEKLYSHMAGLESCQAKISYVGLPLISQAIHQRIDALKQNAEHHDVHVLFAGYMNPGFRDPSLFMKLVAHVDLGERIVCDFYSKTDLKVFKCEECDQMPEKYVSHGYVSPDELDKAIANSDFLLNIGNPLAGIDYAVPSKIFMYMSTGKPIVHLMSGAADTSLEYLLRYENCLIIDPENDFGENVAKLQSFMRDNKKKNAEFDQMSQKFVINMPVYTVDRIEEAFAE